MRLTTVREFRAKTNGLLRSNVPVLVMRGEGLAGILFPCPELTLPLSLKRGLHPLLCAHIKGELRRRSVLEEEVLGDFQAWREKRPATRGRGRLQ